MNFTIFDLETTGLQTRFDYALTFSAKTVDSNFNLIDQIDLQTGLRPGLIPSVFAIATNKLKISDLRKSNLSFFEMTKQIFQYLEKHCPSYIIGHNSLNFDEEILRSQFYQCLLPVYPTQTNGNQRGDTLVMSRAAAAFSPGSIQVGNNKNDNPDFTLEGLASINNFEHLEAHTAASDVSACLEILRKIKISDPNFFEACLKTTSKKGIQDFMLNNLAFCYSQGVNKKLIMTNCVKLDSSYVTFDLNEKPDDFLDLSAKDLTKIIRKKDSPFHFIKNNKQPILVDLSYKKYTICDLSDEEILLRARKINSHREFQKAVKLAAELTEKEWPVGATVEQQIFSGGFPKPFDQNLMKKFHESDWNERVELASQFEDPRFRELGIRLIYDQNPSLLDKQSIDLVEKILHNRLHEDDNRPRSLHQAVSEFEEYKEKNPGVHITPLVEFEEYLKAI